MALALIARNALTKIQGPVKLSVALTKPKNFSQFNKLTFTFSRPNQLSRGISLSEKRLGHGGNYSKLWTLERFVSAGLLALIPLDLMIPSTILDHILAVVTTVHLHWGHEAIVIDYVRPVLFGPTIPKLAVGSLYILSALILGGLIHYNINDLGIGGTFRKIWSVRE